MSSAKQLFDDLLKIKSESAPEILLDAFVDYCQKTLGSIERVHFDFKEKQDRRDGHLGDKDKKNLAKAMSGFANSEGGVLIWGISDQSLHPKPVTDIEKCIDSMLQLCHQVASPAVVGVDGFCIANPNATSEGFGVIYVPESDLPPHRCILNDQEIKDRYFVRSGSSFVAATHWQLEDMFGRRPKSHLRVLFDKRRYGLDVLFKVILENTGRGIAKHPFLEISVNPPFSIGRFGLDGNGKTGMRLFDYVESRINQHSHPDFISAKFTPKDGQVIHAGMAIEVTSILGTCGPSVSKLEITTKLAAEGQLLVVETVVFDKPSILSLDDSK